jgi:hypothetical protein
MLTHLKSTCKKYPGKFDKSQSKLSFKAKKEGKCQWEMNVLVIW